MYFYLLEKAIPIPIPQNISYATHFNNIFDLKVNDGVKVGGQCLATQVRLRHGHRYFMKSTRLPTFLRSDNMMFPFSVVSGWHDVSQVIVNSATF